MCGEVARAVEARRDELVRAARASRAQAAAETRAATSQAAQRLREATALLHFSIEALKESDPAAFLQVQCKIIMLNKQQIMCNLCSFLTCIYYRIIIMFVTAEFLRAHNFFTDPAH